MNIKLPLDKQPTLRIRPSPNDANKSGDIFGGWLMSQIDIAGSIAATLRAHGPVSTVAVKELTFLKPLFTYDLVSFYSEILSVGNTSITVHVQVFVERLQAAEIITLHVSEATLVYVAVSQPGEKRKVPV